MNTRCFGIVALMLVCATAIGSEQDEKKASIERGLLIFQTYCMQCHGAYGDGKGRAARNLKPPPANLRTSTVTDAYKEEIIRKGGAAMNRSPYMPPWGQELTDEQIKDVIAYLQTINVHTKSRASKPRKQ